MSTSDEQPDLQATGERLIPEAAAGELVLAEHLARYHLAARLARGRRVLDVACGEGYGSAILAAADATSVVGVDIDEATVAHARTRYGIDARVADAAALPLADGEVDFVVSFETIEHLAEPERALDEFARVLSGEGLLLISTPNPAEYLEQNPFHLRELTLEEFGAALRQRFAHVRMLYQQNFLASAVMDAEQLKRADPELGLDLRARKVVGVSPDRALYALALCGQRPPPTLAADVAVLSGVYEAHQLAEHARAMRRHADGADQLRDEWERRAIEAERQQRAWEERATEAERQNAELRATLDRIAHSISWRLTRPLRMLRGSGR